MPDKHFRITADATGAEAAAKSIAKSFRSIATQIGNVNTKANGLIVVTDLLKKMGWEAVRTSEKMMLLAFRTQMAVLRMKAALKSVKDDFPDFGGGLGGGGRATKYAKGADMRERPLFGNRGAALEQGQAVQNAVMAMLPLLVPAVLVAAGKFFEIEQDVSEAKLSNALARAGAKNQLGAFRGMARGMGTHAGGSLVENEALAGEIALSGMTNEKQVANFMNLAKGIEQAGGSALSFAKALREDGPEMAAQLRGIGKELGLQIDESSSVNETLAALNIAFGDLAHEVESAKQGFPELWRTMKENLAMLGEVAGGSNAVAATTALLKGQTTGDLPGASGTNAPGQEGYFENQSRAGFLARVMNTNFSEQMESAKGGKTPLSLSGPYALGDVVNRATTKISEEMQSGLISKETAQQRKRQLDEMIKANDGTGLYNLAYGSEAPVPGDAVFHGDRGAARPEEKKKGKKSPFSSSAASSVTINVRSETFGPAKHRTSF